jgi:hypothetical protein
MNILTFDKVAVFILFHWSALLIVTHGIVVDSHRNVSLSELSQAFYIGMDVGLHVPFTCSSTGRIFLKKSAGRGGCDSTQQNSKMKKAFPELRYHAMTQILCRRLLKCIPPYNFTMKLLAALDAD